MGAARTSQILAHHIWGWMIHLVEIRWGHRVHLSNSPGSGNCNRIGFHYLLHAHHGLHHCGHLLFHGLHVGLHLLLRLLYFTHRFGIGTVKRVLFFLITMIKFIFILFHFIYFFQGKNAMSNATNLKYCKFLRRTRGWINLDFSTWFMTSWSRWNWK